MTKYDATVIVAAKIESTLCQCVRIQLFSAPEYV